MPIVKNESEIKPQTDPTPIPTKQELNTKLSEIVDKLNAYVGKKNHNPFLFIEQQVKPLIKQVASGNITASLVEKINQLHSNPVVPVINPSLAPEAKPQQVNEALAGPRVEAPKLSPTGLNLPTKE